MKALLTPFGWVVLLALVAIVVLLALGLVSLVEFLTSWVEFCAPLGGGQ